MPSMRQMEMLTVTRRALPPPRRLLRKRQRSASEAMMTTMKTMKILLQTVNGTKMATVLLTSRKVLSNNALVILYIVKCTVEEDICVGINFCDREQYALYVGQYLSDVKGVNTYGDLLVYKYKKISIGVDCSWNYMSYELDIYEVCKKFVHMKVTISNMLADVYKDAADEEEEEAAAPKSSKFHWNSVLVRIVTEAGGEIKLKKLQRKVSIETLAALTSGTVLILFRSAVHLNFAQSLKGSTCI